MSLFHCSAALPATLSDPDADYRQTPPRRGEAEVRWWWWSRQCLSRSLQTDVSDGSGAQRDATLCVFSLPQHDAKSKR